ncbi:DEAD/DEAH box helicase family protein [Candidatus Sumerlaeota bacterium]|nr:DEAD/DEAH box helicase family protein [Candidatus Sumerlaeota bacterium]
MNPTTSAFAIEDHINAGCRSAMKEIIARNNGVEVFFVGKVDEHGLVTDVDAFAFGDDGAVPATIHQAQWGDVVIHNHPSGGLEPSPADINVSSELSDLGVGSFIVNNAVDAVRVIVKPFPLRETEPIPAKDIEAIFGPDGALARKMPDFELRPQQLEMAREVNEAFNNSEIAVIEAGTGVGKSLAYLAPAVLWAVRNKERVVISTNTINLQEQLIHKDIPALRDLAGLKFDAVLVKGRGNYVSIRRARHAREEFDLFGETMMDEMRRIQEWLSATQDGSLSDLSFEPEEDTWERVQSQTDNCMRLRCPHYQDCFFFKSRRAASRAQVIVTNHHLLMADLQLRRETENYSGMALLPPYKRVILDEAHNLEEVATSYLGSHAGRRGMQRLLLRLYNPRKAQGGVLPALAQKLASLYAKREEAFLREAQEIVWERLVPQVNEIATRVNETFDQIHEALGDYMRAIRAEKNQQASFQLRVTRETGESAFWGQVFLPAARELFRQIRALSEDMKKALQLLRGLEDEDAEWMYGNMMDLNSAMGRLNAFNEGIRLFATEDENVCRWFEGRKSATDDGFGNRRPALNFCSAPLDISEGLRQTLFNVVKTCVLTSATLAVDNKFDYFLQRVGLQLMNTGAEKTAPRECRQVTLDTPFDYASRCLIGIPSDIAEPNARGFEQQLEEMILRAIPISRGRAFVLFTSHRLMDKMHEQLALKIEALGFPCYKQGGESRHRLLDRFRREKHSVLFATSSFWEGVDVKGESLTLLILTRLPFRVPTEPILQARVEYLERHGRNAFLEFSVPQAVIRFKQGFGRLIRHKDDYGAVLILDRRVTGKFYGKTFLNSLPPAKKIDASREELLKALNTFLNRFA